MTEAWFLTAANSEEAFAHEGYLPFLAFMEWAYLMTGLSSNNLKACDVNNRLEF